MVSSCLRPVVYRVYVPSFVLPGVGVLLRHILFCGSPPHDGLSFFLLTDTIVCVTMLMETFVVLIMLTQTSEDVNYKKFDNFGGLLWSSVRDLKI